MYVIMCHNDARMVDFLHDRIIYPSLLEAQAAMDAVYAKDRVKCRTHLGYTIVELKRQIGED